VTVPIQIWNGTIDRNVPIEKSAAVVRRLLPKPPEFHAVPGAGHFTFLTPCPSVIRWAWFCTEADGFDRIAFHREFNRSMITFFKRNI
jgi:predicted dienelactone hydrolase